MTDVGIIGGADGPTKVFVSGSPVSLGFICLIAVIILAVVVVAIVHRRDDS